MILYPVFIHMYLELVYNGHEQHGELFSAIYSLVPFIILCLGAQWISGRVLDLRLSGRRFEPHQCHCVVSLSKNINPSLVLVQPRKTGPFITERLLMGRKESNQTNKQVLCLGSIGYVKNELNK